MNKPGTTPSNPALPLSTAQNPQKRSRFGWFQLVAGNPFYLISPVLLLYGLSLVASDPEMLGQEVTSLPFNFSSLGLYELFLVVTAISLACRKLRYDAGLLLWLENILLFVPFLLLSQASFLSQDAAIGFALIAVLLAIARWTLQYRYFPQINLPLRLLAFGFGLLLLNALYPLLFHFFVTVKGDNLMWPALSYFSWTLILPAAMLLGNWLCRPVEGRESGLQGSWLPLAFYSLWLTGTAVNLRSIDYVDHTAFRPGLVIPLIWALTWTVWLQIGDLDRRVSYHFRDRLLWVPVLLPALSGLCGEPNIFFALIAVNILAICSLGRRVSTQTRREVLIISAVMAFAGLPEIWAAEVIPFFTRGKCVLLVMACCAIGLTLRRSHFRAGLVGALLTGLTTQYYFGRLDYLEQFALDTALIFGLVHSLGWREPVGRPIRLALGLGWVTHGVVWVRIAGGDLHQTAAFISWLIPLSGMLVMACYLIHRLRCTAWWPLEVPLFGLLVVLIVPINGAYEALRITPLGYLAVLGSFIVFAAGTGFAFVREKLAGQAGDIAKDWNMTEASPIGGGDSESGA